MKEFPAFDNKKKQSNNILAKSAISLALKCHIS